MCSNFHIISCQRPVDLPTLFFLGGFFAYMNLLKMATENILKNLRSWLELMISKIQC